MRLQKHFELVVHAPHLRLAESGGGSGIDPPRFWKKSTLFQSRIQITTGPSHGLPTALHTGINTPFSSSTFSGLQLELRRFDTFRSRYKAFNFRRRTLDAQSFSCFFYVLLFSCKYYVPFSYVSRQVFKVRKCTQYKSLMRKVVILRIAYVVTFQSAALRTLILVARHQRWGP